MYPHFLSILSQLVFQKKAKQEVFGREILIEKRGNQWELSTLIFQGEKNIPFSGMLRFLEKGPFIKTDLASASVTLVYEMKQIPDYKSFRSIIPEFIKMAEEWREILYA